MDSDKLDMFIMTHSKFFEGHHIPQIKEKLKTLDDDKWSIIQTLQFKDPTMLLIISILIGGLGIDRFMIGDTGLGILKLVTCGGLGIWTIVDWFLIMGLVKEKNLEKLNMAF